MTRDEDGRIIRETRHAYKRKVVDVRDAIVPIRWAGCCSCGWMSGVVVTPAAARRAWLDHMGRP